jgi:putative ATP-dependent endonuclease of OLD family
LVIKRRLSENDWRALLRCYADAALHPRLRDLQRRAAALLSDEELRSLEIYARRTRGEIFFARCWLLCEGQSEVAILPRLAEMMDISLDAQGIALIDYKNNGSPGAFAALARALDFPWFMFCDDDDGGRDHIREIEKYGFLPEEVKMRIRKLPGTDLEGFLTQQFPRELNEAATRLGAKFTLAPEDPAFVEKDLIPFLRQRKTGSASLLADALHEAGPEKVPAFFKEILNLCREAANA